MRNEWPGIKKERGRRSQGDVCCLRVNLLEDMYGRRGEGCIRCSFSRCMGIVGTERGGMKGGREVWEGG